MPALLAFTWPYALAFWGVFAWMFWPEFRIVFRRGEPPTSPQDANSKRLIIVGQNLALFAAFAAALSAPFGVLPHPLLLFWLGIAMMIGGSLLRRHCFRMLGTSFTGTVIVKPDQMVVERGAYRFVRHPSYTAGTILSVGIALALANWISVAVVLAMTLLVYLYRIRVEERALIAVVGEPYRRYMQRTKRFIPFLY